MKKLSAVFVGLLMCLSCGTTSKHMLRSDCLPVSCVLEMYYEAGTLPDGTRLDGEDLAARQKWLELVRAGAECRDVLP